MPKGEHLRKYLHLDKWDARLNIRLNSEILKVFKQIVGDPQEWIRASIRKKVKLMKKNKNKEGT